ncbi:dTDP-glucose 4,6-dehydratase [Paenibacillus sp. PR3]|uniref:dTDP-glucose 4,6-dehydratase n=1 Tax=Paenibacillus terricola TaxID=2763503 RepID=A0ABR8MZV8_9BACL|nr:dTDP-glucose 4,6-dehydratase [Paenibacillus terricola]MBD3921476.1 dTDP-glucose 4,6-dehydratase [Paenibacillus terricola]
MNILVTGGAGFIGSNFIQHMLDNHDDYHIINLDKLTYSGNLENLSEVQSRRNYKFIKGSICDQKLVDEVIIKYDIDVIINFAAESHVDRSFQNPFLFTTNNVLGTQSLLDAAKNHGLRFVQISTDEVYGELGDTGVFTEDSPISPNNPYAASKASADLHVLAYHRTYGLPINIVRFANTYGPKQYPEKLIPMTITNALQDMPIYIHGEGKSIRDWLYVVDNVEAIRLVMENGIPGEVYNIGARQECQTLETVYLILDYLRKPRTLIKFVEDRPCQDYRYANDPSKIMSHLHWKAQYDFEVGLRKTIQWYMDNRRWWRSHDPRSVESRI